MQREVVVDLVCFGCFASFGEDFVDLVASECFVLFLEYCVVDFVKTVVVVVVVEILVFELVLFGVVDFCLKYFGSDLLFLALVVAVVAELVELLF